MTNLEKYNNAFVEVFSVETSELSDTFSKCAVNDWDSIHQLNIITLLEELFDIMLDPEDIIEFTSYNKGCGILQKYGIDL